MSFTGFWVLLDIFTITFIDSDSLDVLSKGLEIGLEIEGGVGDMDRAVD